MNKILFIKVSIEKYKYVDSFVRKQQKLQKIIKQIFLF